MCLLYLVGILIIFLLLWKLCSYKYKSKSRKIENFEQNTKSFIEPENMFYKALSDIKLSDKIILQNVVSKCYLDKDTIEPELNNKVNDILKETISHINKIIKEGEYFIKRLEGLYIIKDNTGNFRLIISSFIYDVKNYYQVKFIMDIVFMKGEYYINYMNIDERATNNIVNKYDVRNVNNNSIGVLLSYDMVNDDLEDTLNQYYRTNNNIIDFTNINKNEYNFIKISDLSKYYLPENVPNLFSPTFCDKESDSWDQNGVPNENDNIPKSCVANNNAITKILNQPYDAPGVLYSDKNSDFSWMFNIFSNPGVITRDNSGGNY